MDEIGLGQQGDDGRRAVAEPVLGRAGDGPDAEAKDIVGGYITVEAEDIAQAVELSKGCPILEVGGSVEVRPVQRLNM